jgi:hypothetical protein
LLEKRGLKGCVRFNTNIMDQLAFTPRRSIASRGAFDTKDKEQQEESDDELMVSTA